MISGRVRAGNSVNRSAERVTARSRSIHQIPYKSYHSSGPGGTLPLNVAGSSEVTSTMRIGADEARRFLRSWFLQAPIALALVSIAFWRGKVWDLPEIAERLDWPEAVGVLALNLPLLPLWALRSRLVLSRLGYGLPMRSLLPLTVLGNVAGTLTPGGVGDIVRGVALRRQHSVDRAAAAAAVLYERIYLPALTLIAIGVAALAELMSDTPWLIPFLALIGGCLAAASGKGYSLLLGPLRRWARRRTERSSASGRGSWVQTIAEADERLVHLFDDLRLGTLFALLTGVVYALTALQVWLVVGALGGNVSATESWVAYALASYAALLSVLPGGLGVWDAALPAILSGYGVELAIGTAATVVLRGLQTLPLGLLAVACYLALVRERGGERTAATAAPGR